MFNFTKQEKQAIQFLLSIILAGVLISFFQKTQFCPKISASFKSDTAKLDLNSATQTQLMDYLSLSREISQRIIDYRQEKGGFKEIDELIEIKGIGRKTVNKIKNKLYLSNE